MHGDDLEPGGDPRGEEISPVRFRPLETEPRIAGPRRLPWRGVGLALLAAVVLGAGWFSATAVSVGLHFEPEPDNVSFPDTWLAFALADRVLLQPGSHRVRAIKDGYLPLEHLIEVTRDGESDFAFTLVEAPGSLTVRTSPPATLPVEVEGRELGATPLVLELSRGTHQITVRGAPDFTDRRVEVEIEGRGAAQELEVSLVSARSPVTITSIPQGATVLIDGDERGVTPATLSVGAGRRRVELRLPGFASATAQLDVEAGTPQELPPFTLQRAPGKLEVTSVPSGAEVTVGAEYAYRGRTPVTLDLAPGEAHRVSLFKAGYERAHRSVEVSAGARSQLSVTLAPMLGRVELVVAPEDASVSVDGEARGRGSQTLELVAIRHEIAVAKPGYQTQTVHVTPRPGFPQHVEVSLATQREHREATRPEILRSARGPELRLIRGGRFRLGSSRGERGRRPNETLVSVEITRPYYLAERETTNRDFRAFRPDHGSGRVAGESLDGDEQPVAGVTWEDAARYCNWMSRLEGLPLAYEERGDRIVPVETRTTGYRLPSEAEWVWAARYAGGKRDTPLRFPWGEEMPPADGAGNYADASAAGALPNVLTHYRDGYVVSAPVAQWAPNAAGIHDLGGNVAEWVQDFYSIYPSGLESRLRDPLGPKSGRYHVIRGSSWRDSSVSELRLGYRDYGDQARDDVGFRVARDAD